MACPSPEILAQLDSSTLSDDERGAAIDHAATCSECHAAVCVIAQLPERAPMRVARYELRRVVGRGAMGIVYAAFDPELGRELAIKLLRPRAAIELRREAQALARLAHPHVVRIYDVGEHDGRTFIAMELVDGETLRAWLRTRRSLAAILDVMIRAGRGLAAAHRAGLVHRDFKPDNVLVARDGGVLVADLGLARHIDDGGASGAVAGTPAYMAPEQAAGDATPASDQYAFCVTLWEACFGERPPAMRGGGVPRGIQRALRRGLAPDPRARFADMESLLRALDPPRRPWRWAGAGLAVAAAAVAAVWLALPAPGTDRCSLVEPAWHPALEASLAARWGPGTAGGFARYATRWRQQRTEACRATYERQEQSLATYERQRGCLDRARAALATTVDVMLSASPPAYPRPEHAIEQLPALDRCAGAPPVELAPALASAAAVATLDRELAVLELGLLAGYPTLASAEAIALRRRAEAIGHAPQIRRALRLEAEVALWNGERGAAEAALRALLVRADAATDDFTRAHASALLARLLADRRRDEAAGLLATARAALDRAGADPTIEQAVLEAEAALAAAAGDAQTVIARRAAILAAARTRYGEDSPIVGHLYLRLGAAHADAGDFAAANAASRTASELARRDAPRSVPHDLLTLNPNEWIERGDFEGAIRVARIKLAALADLPDRPRDVDAYLATTLASALELDGDYRGAAAAYRDVEQRWSLPPAALAGPTRPPDHVTIANGIVDAVVGQGACLDHLGQVDAAIAQLRRADALSRAGGDATAAARPRIARALAHALVAAGQYREARSLLEPLADELTTGTTLPPYPRATALFVLAQARWAAGDIDDRASALALAADAEQQLARAIADGASTPFLRKLPALAREELAQLAAWRAARISDGGGDRARAPAGR